MTIPFQGETIADLYKFTADQYGSKPAFGTRKPDKTWELTSYKELYDMGLNLATALIELGVEFQEHVGLLADNRLEWIVTDIALQLCGAADVPRGTDVTDDDIRYIIPHSGASVVFVEHKNMMEKLNKNRAELPNVKTVILMKKDDEPTEGVLRFYDLIEKGKELRAQGDKKVEERTARLTGENIFTLIYTSGTTGAPKGVMLKHSNMVSQVVNIDLNLQADERILSILPVWHVFERVFEMVGMRHGACTYYTNVRNIGDDLKSVKPTFMGSAPRLWESLYLKILGNVKSAPTVRRSLFHAAYFCSRMVKSSLFFLRGNKLDMTGRNPIVSGVMSLFHISRILFFYVDYLLLDLIVLSKIRAATGGALLASVSGGGALPPHIDEFFNYIGIPVLEGYGMTETSPVLAHRTQKDLVIGTVGIIVPKTDVRILNLDSGNIVYSSEDPLCRQRGVKGELHVKGPQVMKGYYKNQEATDKVLIDGWMNTGDIAMITYNNCLKLLGRSKDTVVLTSGENVEPTPIENALSNSPLIHQCMVIGQDQKALGVLIVLSLEGFNEVGHTAATLEELNGMAEVQKLITKEVKRLVSADKGFKSFERVQDFRLLPKEFEVGEELTNLFKPKRHVITGKYETLITDIYKD